MIKQSFLQNSSTLLASNVNKVSFNPPLDSERKDDNDDDAWNKMLEDDDGREDDERSVR